MSEKNSQQNNNGLSEKSCFPIMDILPVGKENAISTTDLVKIAGCTSPRDLQERIALERNAGAVICSGSGSGYWRAKNRQELLEFVHCMDARAKNTLAATRSAKRALQLPDGQLEIGGVSRWLYIEMYNSAFGLTAKLKMILHQRINIFICIL